MAISRKHLLSTALFVASASLLAGCSSSGSARNQMIRADVTPELETLAQRQIDLDNADAVTADENGRMFMEDFRRFWLLDHSSRLTPEPTIH